MLVQPLLASFTRKYTYFQANVYILVLLSLHGSERISVLSTHQLDLEELSFRESRLTAAHCWHRITCHHWVKLESPSSSLASSPWFDTLWLFWQAFLISLLELSYKSQPPLKIKLSWVLSLNSQHLRIIWVKLRFESWEGPLEAGQPQRLTVDFLHSGDKISPRFFLPWKPQSWTSVFRLCGEIERNVAQQLWHRSSR